MVQEQLGQVDEAAKWSATAAASAMAGSADRISRSFGAIKLPSFEDIKGPRIKKPDFHFDFDAVDGPQIKPSIFQKSAPLQFQDAPAPKLGPVQATVVPKIESPKIPPVDVPGVVTPTTPPLSFQREATQPVVDAPTPAPLSFEAPRPPAIESPTPQPVVEAPRPAPISFQTPPAPEIESPAYARDAAGAPTSTCRGLATAHAAFV